MSENDLKVLTRSGTSPEIISLLKQTVFGTKGKVRYRQKHIAEGMKSQRNLEFIQILKRNRVLGTTGVATRQTSGLGDGLRSFYVRYLSVNNPFRKKEKKRGSKLNRKKSRANNHLKKMIGDQITNHFEQPVYDNGSKASFYAFVESENYNSKELCINLGFYPTRKISTVLFSRFSPKKSPKVSIAEHQEEQRILKQLSSFYKTHSYYFEDRLFEVGSYYIAKHKGEVVAGIRCKPVNWEIVEVPGLSGFLMQKVLPYLPFTNRLFNPNNLVFLAFDYAWGKTQAVLNLMEHCCSESEINLGMFWGDLESTLISELKKSGQLGFLYKLNGEVTAEVMQRFINMDNNEQKELLQKPVFVSALDMT
ncbi:MAG: hypothetical protein JJ971_13680 [Balneolaceae bacterium]|nr:hypothetical protein [Balneolaceae bacterium]MBO6547093.1 hypothetical protein [Balneolaceae bacterium]MBO6647960.1 hypothetical protein [Balneolaceae bacterium]